MPFFKVFRADSIWLSWTSTRMTPSYPFLSRVSIANMAGTRSGSRAGCSWDEQLAGARAPCHQRGELLSRFLEQLGLDVEDPDGDIGRHLVDLAPEHLGREMTRHTRERVEPVRERGLDDERLETAHLPRHAPEALGRPRVPAVDEAGLAVVDHVPGGRYGVLDRHRGDPQLAYPRFPFLDEGAEPEHRARPGRDRREVGPERVVEGVDAKRLDDGRDAGHRHLPLRADHGEGVGEEGKPGHVVQVGVADQRVPDLHLLGHREGPADRAGIDEDGVVHEKCRRPLALPLAAVGSENLELQSLLRSGRFTIGRILVYQPLERQGY